MVRRTTAGLRTPHKQLRPHRQTDRLNCTMPGAPSNSIGAVACTGSASCGGAGTTCRPAAGTTGALLTRALVA
eukprot:scaffold227_cov309-Prasinococcus_capsulatus_cf.AAC.5